MMRFQPTLLMLLLLAATAKSEVGTFEILSNWNAGKRMIWFKILLIYLCFPFSKHNVMTEGDVYKVFNHIS